MLFFSFYCGVFSMKADFLGKGVPLIFRVYWAFPQPQNPETINPVKRSPGQELIGSLAIKIYKGSSKGRPLFEGSGF